MWFSPHYRRAQNIRTTSAFAGVCFLFCAGCTQLPKLETQIPPSGDMIASGQMFTESGVISRAFEADEEIPEPNFDDDTRKSRIASSGTSRGLIARPIAFEWLASARSAGGRDIETITVGNGGYRTLVIGSLAGDDPLAIDLTEQLAKYVHKNSIILGGIKATIIRNANPDGEELFQMENENGVYLNREFPEANVLDTELLQREPEIRFIVGMLQDEPPQRVVHIRTYSRRNPDAGAIAASRGSKTVAQDASDWLKLKYLPLPQNSADGTLERLLSTKDECEIITLAIPQNSDKATLWESYGDSLLNLLLDEDYETRKLARMKKSARVLPIAGPEKTPRSRGQQWAEIGLPEKRISDLKISLARNQSDDRLFRIWQLDLHAESRVRVVQSKPARIGQPEYKVETDEKN